MYSKDIKEDLKSNFKEFYEGGKDSINSKKYNLAVASLFKAIAVMADYKIYSEFGSLPKNHNERFRILSAKLKPVYELVSEMFKKYTDSYNLRMEQKDAKEVLENVEKLKKIINFE